MDLFSADTLYPADFEADAPFFASVHLKRMKSETNPCLLLRSISMKVIAAEWKGKNET